LRSSFSLFCTPAMSDDDDAKYEQRKEELRLEAEQLAKEHERRKAQKKAVEAKAKAKAEEEARKKAEEEARKKAEEEARGAAAAVTAATTATTNEKGKGRVQGIRGASSR